MAGQVWGPTMVVTLRRMLFCALALGAMAMAVNAVASGSAPEASPEASPVASPGASQGLRDRLQMIVVTTPDWNAVDGRLQRYERSHAGGVWTPVGHAVAIVVGKNGLAWGSGLMSVPDSLPGPGAAPVKREGDGRSPAGAFAIGTGFGYAATAPAGWKLSYTRLTPTIECVDDASSRYYNQLVDRAAVTPDWNSSEHMASTGEYYRWGASVSTYGAAPARGPPAAQPCRSLSWSRFWRGSTPRRSRS
jgi:D-alanyl-D-alanine dipeptidase